MGGRLYGQKFFRVENMDSAEPVSRNDCTRA
jgi:hypothetical protein